MFIVTADFIDEADVLGDRVGIIKDGKLATSGSTLFLKHHFGAGYSLRFDSRETIDISKLVDGAHPLEVEKQGSYQWSLHHGSEASFPDALRALNQQGATNVKLELTTLEEIFLKMEKEECETESDSDALDVEGEEATTENVRDVESSEDSRFRMVWQQTGVISIPSFFGKVIQVQNFMLSNAWRMKGAILFNITMPIMYVGEFNLEVLRVRAICLFDISFYLFGSFSNRSRRRCTS